ncbi:PspC domain-containing protein [Glaciihabitans sp. dw_435]|uniref:ATP-binding protein n=1 Tax=Glaciihabitans sp. dw_435 TaxID=2720081 RepID=UPI0027DB1616|nr:PspC domain-containing protein [Glaciihabitans sp. dw_435]
MITTLPRPPLVRVRGTILGGVCAGLAVHLGWPVSRVRLITVILAFCGGSGVLLYLWLWALVPVESRETDDPTVQHRRAPIAALLLAVAAVAAVVTSLQLLLRGSESAATDGLVFVAVATGAAVTWSLTLDRHDPGRSPRYGVWIRVWSAVLLLLVGTAALGTRPTAVNAVFGVVLVVLGVGVIAAPRVLTLWTDLMAERSARVREEQRAEIAAHLHDSVLQTLALIQNRAGASTEVARIARAQERELRDWLFAGDAPAAADLATTLREVAAAIELDYPVRIDVVAAGEAPASNAALVAAAREAMLNAARHAGGDVSVYLETRPGSVDVFVRDRGPGVDLDALPSDRLGIKESIIRRMTRAGGTATVRPGAGSGTEVHLHLEVSR